MLFRLKYQLNILRIFIIFLIHIKGSWTFSEIKKKLGLWLGVHCLVSKIHETTRFELVSTTHTQKKRKIGTGDSVSKVLATQAIRT